MTDLDAAGKMFDQAVTQLEQTLNQWAESTTRNSTDWASEREKLEAELGSLKEDHARVSRQLKELGERHDALRQVSDTVSGQLDATVDELTELLEA